MQRKARWLPVVTRKFLGYNIGHQGVLRIAKQSLERVKTKVRTITKRNRGRSLELIIQELNELIPGWVRYFKYAESDRTYEKLDKWLRHKLRCYRLKQLKRAKTIAKMLMQRGIETGSAWMVATSGKGWWRLSGTPQVHKAMGNKWWELNGLKTFTGVYVSVSL